MILKQLTLVICCAKLITLLPTQLNWKERGYVTPVKNEDKCVSDWAFSAVSLAESTLILQGFENESIDLSQKYIISCTSYGGCNISDIYKEYALEKILQGVPLQAKFPYDSTSDTNICQTQEEKKQIAKEALYYYNLNQQQVIELLQEGPVMVTVSMAGWPVYTRGILRCESITSDDINHAALLIGYTQDYWIIKNNWSAGWGEDGYIRVSRATNKDCGVGKEVFKFKMDCPVFGCKQCLPPGTARQCTKCYDQAVFQESKCSCPNSLVFNSNFICTTCEVPYCKKCLSSSSSTCQECDDGLKLNSGLCKCQSGKLPDSNGICSDCNVVACLSCAAGDPNQCRICQDHGGAYINNGACNCFQGFQFSSQYEKCIASTCQLQGCLYCSASNICQKCSDSIMRIIDGRCKCKGEGNWMYDPNQNGKCDLCNIPGCASCFEVDKNLCRKCLDPLATLVEGECKCPNSTKLSSSEKCITVDNPDTGCLMVDHHNFQKCTACSNSYTLINGKCMHQEYTLPGCVRFANANDIYNCQKCLDSMILDKKKCYCADHQLSLNEINECQECYATGCKMCLSSNPYKCFRCQIGYTLNSDRKCTSDSCKVIGCRSCVQGDPEKCQVCIDRESHIVNGQCKCYSGDLIVDEYGFCRSNNQTFSYINLYDTDKSEVTSLNWADHGYVTSIKDRLERESADVDWAFAVTALMESTLILEGIADKSLDLAEQYILFCPNNQFQDLTKFRAYFRRNTNKYYKYEIDVPYNQNKTKEQTCSDTAGELTNILYYQLIQTTSQGLQYVLQSGPIGVEISGSFIQDYTGGVYSCLQGEDGSTPVMLVGYTPDYWIIKYNKGTSFGENGYVHLNKDLKFACGIHTKGLLFYRPTLTRYCDNLKGCLICNQPQTKCYVCSYGAQLQGGSCKCQDSGYSINPYGGYCMPCSVKGCNKCEDFDSSKCSVCSSEFTLQDGQCKCSTDGVSPSACNGCTVLGCQVCSASDTNVCEKCSDHYATLINGQCNCKSPYVMNSLGLCQLCRDRGCQQCNSNAEVCQACKNNLQLIDGKCQCFTEDFITNELKCGQCQTNLCTQCLMQSSQCQLCQEISNIQLDFNKGCTGCNAEHCKICQTPNVCHQCIDNRFGKFANGSCSCNHQTFHSLDQGGLCQQCRAQNCITCQSRYETLCSKCQNNAQVVNGKCICNDRFKLNSANICVQCDVQNCQKCSDNDPNICQQCSNFNEQIIDGKCVEICSLGCSACKGGICTSCKDNYEKTESRCSCLQDGYEINQNGECVTPSIIGMIIGIVIGVLVVIAIAIIGFICWKKKKNAKQGQKGSENHPFVSGKQMNVQTIGQFDPVTDAVPPYIQPLKLDPEDYQNTVNPEMMKKGGQSIELKQKNDINGSVLPGNSGQKQKSVNRKSSKNKNRQSQQKQSLNRQSQKQKSLKIQSQKRQQPQKEPIPQSMINILVPNEQQTKKKPNNIL